MPYRGEAQASVDLVAGHPALVKRSDQGAETLPQNNFGTAPSVANSHPGVQRYLREIGVMC